MRLAEGDEEVFDRERVFAADVDKALGGTDGYTADQQALYDGVRVALQKTSVHISARVALVGVADDVLLYPPLAGGASQLPFFTGREAGAAAAAQAGGFDFVYYPLRVRIRQHLLQSGVSPLLDVVEDPDGVELLVVTQKRPRLLPEERDVPLMVVRFQFPGFPVYQLLVDSPV